MDDEFDTSELDDPIMNKALAILLDGHKDSTGSNSHISMALLNPSTGTLSQSELEASLTLLDNTRQSFDKFLQKRAAQLSKRRNALVPFIHRLPEELFIRIVQTASRSENDSQVNRVVELQNVSTRWWQIIRSAPVLWTMIEPATPYQLALHNSGNAPLDVNNTALWNYGPERLLGFFIAAHEHASRWRSLTTNRHLDYLIPRLVDSASSLEALNLRNPVRSYSDPPMLDITPLKQLRILFLYKLPVVWDAAAFRKLEALHVVGTAVNHLPALIKLVDVLRECSSLEVLNLQGEGAWTGMNEVDLLQGWPEDDRSLKGSVHLPNLQELTIASTAIPVFRILPLLQTPPLSKLILDTFETGASPYILSVLLRPLDSSPMLRKLVGDESRLWIAGPHVFIYLVAVEDTEPWTRRTPSGRLVVRFPGFRKYSHGFGEMWGHVTRMPYGTYDVPLNLVVWYDDDDHSEILPYDFPTLTSLTLRVHPTYLKKLFKYLVAPIEDPDGGIRLPCPHLTELRLQSPNITPEDQDSAADMLVARASLARSIDDSGAQIQRELRVYNRNGIVFNVEKRQFAPGPLETW